jgi:hypothetical protein
VVILRNASAPSEEMTELANYLSTVGLEGCEIVVVDPAPRPQFEINSRTLRWVGRHVGVRPEHWTPAGALDVVKAASAAASCEKVIVAAEDVRYAPQALTQLCELLEMHEVAVPQDYLDPLPWWGGIEAGRILVHRGIEPQPDHGSTFGFRRTAVRALRTLTTPRVQDVQPRRLAIAGAEVHAAHDVFVRRHPARFQEWVSERPRQAEDDFALPMKTAFFFSLAPLMILLALLGGMEMAGGYASIVGFASIALALRGRTGARSFFPLRAAFFAPLWVFERSVSVYWALFRKLRGSDAGLSRVAIPDRGRGTQVASGQ